MLHIEQLASECMLVRHDMDKFRVRLTEAENRIGSTEDLQASQLAQITELQLHASSLINKVEDAENCQRRNHISLMGLPKGALNQWTLRRPSVSNFWICLPCLLHMLWKGLIGFQLTSAHQGLPRVPFWCIY